MIAMIALRLGQICLCLPPVGSSMARCHLLKTVSVLGQVVSGDGRCLAALVLVMRQERGEDRSPAWQVNRARKKERSGHDSLPATGLQDHIDFFPAGLGR